MMIKKYIGCLALIFLGLGSYGQESKFTIWGDFPEWDRGPVVLMYRQQNNLLQDTAQVQQGKFHFEGQLQAPARMTVYSIAEEQGRTKDNIAFYLDQGNLELQGTDSLTHARIKGSRLTEEGLLLDRWTGALKGEMNLLAIQGMELMQDSTRQDEAAKLGAAYRVVLDSLTAVKQRFIVDYPNSYLSLNLIQEFMGNAMDYQTVFPLFDGLSEELKTTELGQGLARELRIAERTGLGVILQDFSSQDTLGNRLSLMQVVRKNKYTLVDFWASWCVPCRKENPNVVDAFQAYKDKGFGVLGISLDNQETAWKAAIAHDKLSWDQVSTLQGWKEPAALLYGIRAIPQNMLVDQTGKVVARNLRGAALHRKLAELLD